MFYRRRSSKPLGGPRFAKIFEQFDHVDEEEDGDEADTAGEGQRLGGRSSPTGSLPNGSKAGALRPRPSRNETTTTVRSLKGSDSDDEELPSYAEPTQGGVIHNSIEDDESSAMRGGYQPLTFNAMQGWNFDNLSSNDAATGNPGNGYASDSAQADYSDDDHAMGGQTDVDTEMASGVTSQTFDGSEALPAADDSAQVALADIQNDAWERKDVLDVPATGRSEGSSEVAEIRLENDKNASAESAS